MAAAKINTHWDEDICGNSLLIVEKGRGKLNFDEVADLLRYDWRLQGHYVMHINATEATCGVDWDPFGETERKGDLWELYRIEEQEKCPVCNKVSPFLQYCPECGTDLIDPTHQNKQQALMNAEKVLGAMKKEAVHMIKSTDLQETRKAWYQSHLGSIDFARQMGLITEERRLQLYKEFNAEIRGNENE